MSYPPPQPPMPPGMAPPMMPPGYGYGVPPMGMMPMMGMMPPMMRTSAPSSTSASAASTTTAKPSKKLVPQEIPKDEDEKPPVTTVFVGNISERAPDAMVRQMLQRCGNVLSWKRVQGASGKLQAFGFCEYEYPEATLCCIRLLNDWLIVDKKLLVKVDAKTNKLLEEYQKKKAAKKPKDAGSKKAEGAEEGEEVGAQNGDENGLDEFTLREDRVAKAGLDAIMREYADELAKEPPPEVSPEQKDKRKIQPAAPPKNDPKEGIEELDLEEDEKDLINREINKFRDAHKDEDDKETERSRERDRRKREDEKDKDRRERERERERREREREQERREWEAKERERERSEREREREREREKYRSKTRSRSRSREPSYGSRDRERSERPEKDRDFEDEELMYERKRMERKMREKEAAYQERLKAWEARERKKSREYDKERDKEDDRKAEEAREARRLRQFLEDYDDVRDDPKYYKGSALKKRLGEREKEMEADARDRQREKEEIEDIRRKLLDQGHPDVEIEMARIEREREEHLIPRLNRASPHYEQEAMEPEREVQQPSMKPVPLVVEMPPPPESTMSSQLSQSDDDNDDADDFYPSQQSEDDNSHSMNFIGPATRDDQIKAKMGFSGLKIGTAGSDTASPDGAPPNKKKKLTVGDVFNQDDEQTERTKKRPLVPIDFSEDSNASNAALGGKPATAEEKRRHIRLLIDRIPTAKAELFAYELDWSMVDTTLMDRRIKPWVNKKIVEYIGEEEPTLTDFICQKVMAHSPPQNILNDVSMVLDEEAEVFVVKMWRLLIYEIEAKKNGLVK